MPTLRSLSFILIATGVAISGCGPLLKRMTVSSATEIFRDGLETLYREGDLVLAEQALASNLKLLEVFLETSPDNQDLLILASQGFGAYTFAFVEDKITTHPYNPQVGDLHRERARRLYLRARDFGLRALTLRHGDLAGSLTTDLSAFRAALEGLQREDVPALFWTAYGWAGAINWSRNRPEMLADISRVVAMMRRVLALDEKYFHAGPHLFFGVYYASRSQALGGDPARAKFHLDRALDLTKGNSLLVRLFLADPYAVQIQDRPLFETELRTILDTPMDIAPQLRLLNEIAKGRARLLLERIDERFL